MSKKNFTEGLNSLLGDKIEPNKKKIRLATEKQEPPQIRSKRGRPVTQNKEITKSSQVGTKENETRATFIVNEELLDKVKAIAYWERELIKDTINRALQVAADTYIKKNKILKPIPKK